MRYEQSTRVVYFNQNERERERRKGWFLIERFFITYQREFISRLKIDLIVEILLLLVLDVHMCQITCLKDSYVSSLPSFFFSKSRRKKKKYKQKEIYLSLTIVRRYLCVCHINLMFNRHVYIYSRIQRSI